MQQPTDGLRIDSERHLITPTELINALPCPPRAAETIASARQGVIDIVSGRDPRLVVIVGPCSIHDTKAAMEYAERLRDSAACYADDLLIIMRTYLEKPRTTLGWKGIISDPLLDGSFDINHGLQIARKMLIDINSLGLPTATEFLDTLIPAYLSDLISWVAVGARTAESQIHRELASGLAMPVGFKNTTDGNYKIAIDAVHVARHPHHIVGIAQSGVTAMLATQGNPHCHVILRGSHTATNYAHETIQNVIAALENNELPPRVMVDCSHGNSMKDYRRQANVINTLTKQMTTEKTRAVFGVMIESHLVAGKQSYRGQQPLTYGQSITDACLSWEDTLPLLDRLALAVRAANKKTRS
jgi:3-deoxy-7-phosphoheptulonate synthase